MGARLKFWRWSRVPKKGTRDEAVEILFLAASPLVTAPPSNLTRLCYNGSAAKSHSTTTQYRQRRRLDGFSIGRYEKKRESFDPFAARFKSGAMRFPGKKIAPAMEPFQNKDSSLVLLI